VQIAFRSGCRARVYRISACAAVAVLVAGQASAQAPAGWNWSVGGLAFVDFNVQHRTEFGHEEIESQNWMSATAGRTVHNGSLMLTSVLSLEPFTMKAIGSPQWFQLGGSYLGGPLADHSHPHDLISGLGAAYSHPVGNSVLHLEGDLVGAPALGPIGFENRPTATLNPAIPLSREHLDSTDASSGVLLAGLQVHGITVEASTFRGVGPDDKHLGLDLGHLDSWAARGSFVRGAWTTQLSTGLIHQPETFAPYDVRRTTASITFVSPARPISWMAAWGEDRDRFGILDTYLLDAAIRLSRDDHVYARAELVADDFLDAGYHLLHAVEVQQISTIGAFTVGYVRALTRTVGVGGDVTLYDVPQNLSVNYPSVFSMHVFARLYAHNHSSEARDVR